MAKSIFYRKKLKRKIIGFKGALNPYFPVDNGLCLLTTTARSVLLKYHITNRVARFSKKYGIPGFWGIQNIKFR